MTHSLDCVRMGRNELFDETKSNFKSNPKVKIEVFHVQLIASDLGSSKFRAIRDFDGDCTLGPDLIRPTQKKNLKITKLELVHVKEKHVSTGLWW